MEWQPIHNAPNGRYVLWVDDNNFVGAVIGNVIDRDGYRAYRPDGFHGDWAVTHFAIITPPEPPKE